jgi:serine/threonine protein kinase
MGEDAGRFFMWQLINSVEYMHSRRVVHRDLKLENILIDEQLNLKIADFGFACYKSIDSLRSYRGTMTYMAPEIKEGKVYKGSQVDLFSMGVILFIIVQGIFPFKEARKEEYFYNLLLTGQIDTYFTKVNGHGLSAEFKDLILNLFNYDGNHRPTLQEVKQHPYMNAPGFDFEATRRSVLAALAQKQAEAAQVAQMEKPQKPVKVRRTTTMM